MSQISEKDYREYLIDFKNAVFKILPLYEEENESLPEYIDSVCIELKGLKKLIDGLPYGTWYTKTLATLEEMKIEILKVEHKKTIRRETFRMLDLIDKQIDQLRGE